MNVFNRVAMSFLLVAFMVVAVLLALLPRTVMESLRFALDVADYNLTPPVQLAGAVVGLLLAVAAFLLLLAELRPPGRQGVIVAQVAGGTAELATESIALRVKKAAESIPGVREAMPVIRSRGKSVDIMLRLVSDADVDLPQKSQELMQAVRAETETKMGIPVKDLRLSFKHTPGERRPSLPTSGPSTKSNLPF